MTNRGHQMRLIGILMAALVATGGCGGPEKKTTPVDPIVRDLPAVLTNTVGSIASVNGADPVVVFGYGLVVGLNGTGGGILDDALASAMEREMSIRDLTGPGSPFQGMTPRQFLRDKNVAVVLVQAAVPPASPRNYTFDAYVSALNATSLEGGRLWSTDLYVQSGPPGTLGGSRGRRLATARGPIFINPFSDPAVDSDGVTRRQGRILDGGTVKDPLKLEIRLDDPSHARARRIVDSINTRFPEESGMSSAVAMGRNGQSIAISVPPSYTDRPNEFIRVLQGMPIDMLNPAQNAMRYTESMKSEPWLADQLSYCLLGVGGDEAIKFARGLYDLPDDAPRMAGLKAGARLGDHRAAGPLIKTATESTGPSRLEAIELLADLNAGPEIDLTLRRLLESRELLIRVAAYESLAKRARGLATRRALIEGASIRSTMTADVSDLITHRDVLLRGTIPGNNIQGIRREIVADKFQLDIVEGGEPMMYITQQGQPKIVVFGSPLTLRKPCLVAAWNNRLMIAADPSDTKHRVYFQDYRSGQTYKAEVESNLDALLKFLAHTPSAEDPSPGLGMTYSEVVGALFALHQQRGVICAFATESDKLRAQLLEASRGPAERVRPESPEDREAMKLIEQPKTDEDRPKPTATEPPKPKITPIIRPGKPGDQAAPLDKRTKPEAEPDIFEKPANDPDRDTR